MTTARSDSASIDAASTVNGDSTRGVAMGFAAYSLWGLFPLYFVLLEPAGAWEVTAHRVAWSLVVCVGLVSVMRTWPRLLALRHTPRTLALLAVAAVLISLNWLIYVYGVMNEQVVQAALGYYINPLVTVVLGVVVLRERLRLLQWSAVGAGVVAVGVLTIAGGRLPWIALSLACSFGLYGLVKNRVGRTVTPVHSLSVETALLAPLALALIAWLTISGQATFGTEGTGHALLLASSGAATAIPLLLFAGAAGRIPLSTVGLLQYVTPTLQLLCGVVVLGEPMPLYRWIGFGLIWTALVLLSVDMLRARRVRVHDCSTAGTVVADARA